MNEYFLKNGKGKFFVKRKGKFPQKKRMFVLEKERRNVWKNKESFRKIKGETYLKRNNLKRERKLYVCLTM